MWQIIAIAHQPITVEVTLLSTLPTMPAGLPATDRTPPIALTIAGSDSGGGAGIQADLRTFALHRVHGTSAITCVTAQNTLGVTRVDALPADAVTAQIAAVVDDMGIQALKTGMLFEQAIIEAVASAMEQRHLRNVVVDPVMVSRAGAKLLAEDAIAAMRERIVPLADILTPNRYEAQILVDMDIATLDDMKTAATRIHRLGPKAVLVKGGGDVRRSKGHRCLVRWGSIRDDLHNSNCHSEYPRYWLYIICCNRSPSCPRLSPARCSAPLQAVRDSGNSKRSGDWPGSRSNWPLLCISRTIATRRVAIGRIANLANDLGCLHF